MQSVSCEMKFEKNVGDSDRFDSTEDFPSQLIHNVYVNKSILRQLGIALPSKSNPVEIRLILR